MAQIDLNQPTHYAVLGVDEDASERDIRVAYRGLIRQVHPDSPDGDEKKAATVNAAFQVLSNPDLRFLYDQDLKQARLAARGDSRDTGQKSGSGATGYCSSGRGTPESEPVLSESDLAVKLVGPSGVRREGPSELVGWVVTGMLVAVTLAVNIAFVVWLNNITLSTDHPFEFVSVNVMQWVSWFVAPGAALAVFSEEFRWFAKFIVVSGLLLAAGVQFFPWFEFGFGGDRAMTHVGGILLLAFLGLLGAVILRWLWGWINRTPLPETQYTLNDFLADFGHHTLLYVPSYIPASAQRTRVEAVDVRTGEQCSVDVWLQDGHFSSRPWLVAVNKNGLEVSRIECFLLS